MSIFDPVERVTTAPSWRCPACKTLQPETTRCRACSRAAITCLTCHAFRPTLVGDVGFCADDPARTPIRSDEVRPCWVHEAMTTASEGGLFDTPGSSPAPPAALGSAAPLVPPSPRPASHGHARDEARGRLVEAPHVAPARGLVSELQRRVNDRSA